MPLPFRFQTLNLGALTSYRTFGRLSTSRIVMLSGRQHGTQWHCPVECSDALSERDM